MEGPNVSIVIPNWNGKTLLRECLYSLKKQSYARFKIIVVDNGSTDGSLDFLKFYHPEVKVIRLEKNLGFSRAVNEGIKLARTKYVALLNNDTKVSKNWLLFLIRAIQKNKPISAVASKMILMSGKLDSAGDTMNSVGQAYHRGYGDDPQKWNEPGLVFLVTAGASLYKRRVFSEVGMFDEDFFAYGEDVDWCLKAQLYGHKFWYEPSAIVYHRHKATASRIRRKVEYLQFRNMTLTIIKNFPFRLFFRRWRFITIPLVHFNTLIYMTLHGLLKEALLADFWILTHFLKILQKRWQIQKTRRVSINYLDSQMEPKKIRLYGLLK